MNRAGSAKEFREALRPWYVPTFSVVFADVEGHIGYQAAGRVPLRGAAERGYRPGWDPRHQWRGLISFDGMPRLADPERGWIATANNRPAPEDFPYPLSGTWSDGLRARRIREMIEGKDTLSRDDFAAMHQDALSLRAVRCLPELLKILAAATQPRLREAEARLRAWDGRMEPDRVGATLFDVFFSHWVRAVVGEPFDQATASFVAAGANGLSASLLAEEPGSEAASGKREQTVLAAMNSALDWLADRLGPDMAQWNWGKLHVLRLRHILSGRGDLGQLLDHGGLPVPGDMHTVCNTGLGPAFEARTGAGYRLIADLAMSPPQLWAVDAQSQSGHPGSPHYGDQLQPWLRGEYHPLPLDPSEASRFSVCKLMLEPVSS
jgi:penicillin amidase